MPWQLCHSCRRTSPLRLHLNVRLHHPLDFLDVVFTDNSPHVLGGQQLALVSGAN